MSRFRPLILTGSVVLLLSGLAVAPAAAETEIVETIRVSVATTEGWGTSNNPSISADGSLVVFQSFASNLVPDDTNGLSDVFVRDVSTGVTTRVSVATDGAEASGPSHFPAISADGSTVVYYSVASNLVPGDTNGTSDVFAYDVAGGTTTRVSVATNGTQGNGSSQNPVVSADGSVVVYQSSASNLVAGDTNASADVFSHNTATGVTSRVSVAGNGAEGDAGSSGAGISGDGSTVVFVSSATNLVAGDTNGTSDVFARTMAAGTTSRISVDSLGNQANNGSFGPTISADGSTIAYNSYASNLVAGDTNGNSDVFVHDTATGATVRVSVASNGTQGNNVSSAPALSSDGAIVAFESLASNLVAGDTNGTWDVFTHDRATAATSRISLDSAGAQANHESFDPALTGDGSVVVFESYASNLIDHDTNGHYDVFGFDTPTGATTRISLGNGGDADSESYGPSVSGDGSLVVYTSEATNLVANDTNGERDIFAYDVATGITTRVSVGLNGAEANGDSWATAISADGSTIVYNSRASNLVPADTNGDEDIFAYDVASGVHTLVSVSSAGTQGNGEHYDPAVSGDGLTVAYASDSSNLVANDTNGKPDVFLHDVAAATTTRISVSSSGEEANDGSPGQTAVSGDGSIVVYSSIASNLIGNDTNDRYDVFSYDVGAATTRRVSVGPDGVEGNGNSYSPAISFDRSIVVYVSGAANLVEDDTNTTYDVFAYDVATAATTRISESSSGGQAHAASYDPAVATDGSNIVYDSNASNLIDYDANGSSDVFLNEAAATTTTRISSDSAGGEADAGSGDPAFSADASTIVYHSYASNLVADDTNGFPDVFLTRINRSPVAAGFNRTVAEDVAVGTMLGTVTASDTDDDPLNFAITAGDPGGLFTIGAGSGAVSIAKALDYETTTSHTLIVTVSDGSLTETASVDITVTDVYDPEPGYNPFDDDDGSVFEDDIEWLADSEITRGCGTRLFCPTDNVTRGQMAAFLTRALNLPPATSDYFTDDDTSIFKDDINRLAQSEITRGCGLTTFCPDDYVTRGQMAAFLVRGLSYADDGGGNLFVDDDHSIFESEIDKLATAGVTRGCNPPVNDRFCPTSNVTRGQMAAFLHRALDG